MKRIVELKNVKKTYIMGKVKVPAIQGISFSVKRGEFLSIIGPSGSGKSTILNMVGCLDIPTQGKIFLDGKNIANLAESRLANIRGRKIGFVFQKFNLIQNLNAIENVSLPMTFQAVAHEKRKERSKQILERLGLSNRIEHKPSEMSGGEQQRVAISRALANDPEMILADEPTGNLDSKTGRNVMQSLKKVHKEGKTVVLVTHDKNLLKYSERIIHLKDGIIEKEVKK